MAKVIVKKTEDNIEGKYPYIVFEYLGKEKRLALTQGVIEYHKLIQGIPDGSELQVTRVIKEGYNGKVMEFFRLDKVVKYGEVQ